MGSEGPRQRRWAIALGCFAVAVVSCVPLYVLLQIGGGLLSEAEQRYWAAHRTPVLYVLPAGFRGKGEIDFGVPGGRPVDRESGGVVFRVPKSGRLGLRDGEDVVPEHVVVRVFSGRTEIPRRWRNGNSLSEGAFPAGGVGFYETMDDGAVPANHQGSANRHAFFVGTQGEFERLVEAGKIKPWE